MSGTAPPPEPTVPADAYDREYFLHECMGADVWRESGGQRAVGRYGALLNAAGFQEGMRVLDIGTGRGELVCVAASWGAAEAVGVDYSQAAVELAQETLNAAGNPAGASVVLADARRLPAGDDHFDLAMLLDVVEHLSPEELATTLGEARRTLRPGGAVLVHTAPNALVYDVTYRLQRALRPRRRREWPADPRNDTERRLHVNEQRPGTLRRALRAAGFSGVHVHVGDWVYRGLVPDPKALRLYSGLARLPYLRRFGVFDLFGTGTA